MAAWQLLHPHAPSRAPVAVSTMTVQLQLELIE